MKKIDLIYADDSELILNAAQEIQNSLGPGFLERVYENALVLCMRERGLNAEQQYPIQIEFKGNVIGEYIADILINEKIIVDIKAVKKLDPIHKAQIINYLKATKLKLGILINFGSTRLQFERFVNLKQRVQRAQ